MKQGSSFNTTGFDSVADVSHAREAMRVQCSFKAEFFNEKEVPVGVTDISLVFLKQGPPEIVHSLMAPEVQQYEGIINTKGEFDAFTLQLREVYAVNLETSIYDEDQKTKLLECDCVEFRYRVLNGKKVRKELAKVRH